MEEYERLDEEYGIKVKEKKLKFDKAGQETTPNWKEGIPIDPKIDKRLGCAYFKDERGVKYYWIPEEGELNKIFKEYVDADNINCENLKNSRGKPDILDMERIVKKSIWSKPRNLSKLLER